MSAHTPGPWKYRPLPTCDWGVVLCADGFICQAKDPTVTDADFIRHRSDRTDPHEANARLISAAPDMYEALKEMVRVADANGIDAHYARAVNSARAALAKAGQ